MLLLNDCCLETIISLELGQTKLFDEIMIIIIIIIIIIIVVVVVVVVI